MFFPIVTRRTVVAGPLRVTPASGSGTPMRKIQACSTSAGWIFSAFIIWRQTSSGGARTRTVRSTVSARAGRGRSVSSQPRTNGTIPTLISACFGHFVTRHTAPMMSPAIPPKSANKGTMMTAQTRPSIITSSVPTMNSTFARNGAQK
jgi:hypothetical protein